MHKVLKTFLLALAGTFVVAGFFGWIHYRQKTAQDLQGQTHKAATEKVTIIEGWSDKEIAAHLENQGIVASKDFLNFIATFSPAGPEYDFLASKPQNQSLEGFLFPDTYEIYKNPLPTTSTGSIAASKDLALKMLGNFNRKFTPQMRQDAAGRGMSIYQIVILASIVEKETGRDVQTAQQQQALDAERKTIAGIFYNRLNIGMPLESDATVNYITQKNTPQASLQDTQIDSPYNTYKYTGLPPGPICNPSLSSLMAAVYPDKTDYLFFLHTQPEGTVIYSKTYEEHLKNKQKYLK